VIDHVSILMLGEWNTYAVRPADEIQIYVARGDRDPERG